MLSAALKKSSIFLYVQLTRLSFAYPLELENDLVLKPGEKRAFPKQGKNVVPLLFLPSWWLSLS
jgi:hypothetical protein